MEGSAVSPNGISNHPAPGLTQMRPLSVLERFNKKFNPIVTWLMWIGAGILFFYTCFEFLNVILRYVFNSPLPYDVDLTQIVLSVLFFFSFAYAQLHKSHIVVDLVTTQLQPRAALALETAVYVICLGIAGVLGWQGIVNAQEVHRLGTVTYGGVPLFPNSLAMPLGSLLLFIVFLRDVIGKLIECKENKFGLVRWLLALGAPLVCIVISALCIFNVITPVSAGMAGVISIFILLALIFLGMPVGFALYFIAAILMGYVATPKSGFMTLGSTLFSQVGSYTWIVVPLYILMSYFIMEGGLGTACFYGANKWVGQFKGGLALAVVAGSTFLAAVVGTGTAAAVTMGLVAFPEMRKYRYDDALSTGTIAAGATLGPLIPPSMTFIIFGILTETSIGDLFIAGIIPGLLLALSFAGVIIIWCRMNKSLGPAGPKTTYAEKIKSLPGFAPILALFILIMGGMYLGIFTVIEGGAIGAFGALIIALCYRKLRWKNFTGALGEAVKNIGVILLMITGSLLLTNSLAAAGVGSTISNFVSGLSVPSGIVVALILVIYIVFGIIADVGIIVILTLPILFPTLVALDVNLIWFGVLSTIVGGLGSISPPYALIIFVLRKVACKDVSLSTMYRGIIPFCLATIAVCVVIFIIPEIATWLPDLMRG